MSQVNRVLRTGIPLPLPLVQFPKAAHARLQRCQMTVDERLFLRVIDIGFKNVDVHLYLHHAPFHLSIDADEDERHEKILYRVHREAGAGPVLLLHFLGG